MTISRMNQLTIMYFKSNNMGKKQESDYKALGYAIAFFIVATVLAIGIVAGAQIWMYLTTTP